MNCININKEANNIVKNKPNKKYDFIPFINALCAQVTVNPELNKIIVLNKGNSKAGIVTIPKGGQVQKIQIDGARLEWKKAQKKEAKNIISETINNKKANKIAFCTNIVCCVWLSTIISENQNHKQAKNKLNKKKRKKTLVLKSCKIWTK